jgi:hypothetical protein
MAITNPALNATLGNQSGANYAANLGLLIRNLLNLGFGLAGIYFFFTLILGGYGYITGGGDKEAVQRAMSRIRNAIIGIVIIFSVFVIIYIVETVFGLSIRQPNIPNLI